MWISKQEYESLKADRERYLQSEYRASSLFDINMGLRREIKKLTEDKETKMEEEKKMSYIKKWAIFYEDGSIRTINAYDFTWDCKDETLVFVDEDGVLIACFKLDKIEGVAMVQEDTNMGINAPTIQLPASEPKEAETPTPTQPIIINTPIKDPVWTPSPWTPSDPWWQQPQVTWSSVETKPLAERGTE